LTLPPVARGAEQGCTGDRRPKAALKGGFFVCAAPWRLRRRRCNFSDIYKHKKSKALRFAPVSRRTRIQAMEWVGASVIAPRPNVPIEFEIASGNGINTGFFRDSLFYIGGDPSGYPRKLIRRWRYLDDRDDRSPRNDLVSALPG
jgi:hypothetical protein